MRVRRLRKRLPTVPDFGDRHRQGVRIAEDLRSLLDAMVANAIVDGVAAKDRTELSALSGLPEARVAATLRLGEESGVFERRVRTRSDGDDEVRWQLAPRFVELDRRFAEFADACSMFSRALTKAWARPTPDPGTNVEFNLRIAKTVFSKWSLEIVALLYAQRTAGFQEIHRALGGISSHILSTKLARMSALGLIRREVLGTRPPRVQYSLTAKGLQVAKLGEPVFLYLRFKEGLLLPGRAARAVEIEAP